MAPLLDEVADDSVAEKTHLGPLDTLSQVFLLLLLQQTVYEYLLELLIGKLYDKLFKTILLESLESINV